MNSLRKPYIAIVISIFFLIISCTSNQDFNSSNKSIDYSLYKKSKESILKLKPFNIAKARDLMNSKSDKQAILHLINEPFERSILQIEALEYFNLSGEEIIKKAKKEGIFNDLDVLLLTKLADDLYTFGFKKAMLNFENKIISLDLTNQEFEKYSHFANLFKIAHTDAQKTELINVGGNGGISWACGLAIAGYTLSTIAVGAACVPNPTTPIACPLAVGSAIVAFGSMMAACNNDSGSNSSA